MKNTKRSRTICAMTAMFLIITLVLSSCVNSTEPSGSAGSTPGATSDNGSAGDTQPSGNSTTSSDTESDPSASVDKTSLTRDEFMAQMPEDLKGTTLTYMYWWDPYNQMEKEAIESFTAATGIKVKADVASYSEFNTELNARITAGNAPDLIRILGNSSLGLIPPLQPITNSGYDFNDTAWDAQLMKDYTFNGKPYAANLKNSAILDVAVMYYNKKALQAADMEDPYTIWKKTPDKWTWDKFWSMCDEFVKANGNRPEYYGATFEYYTAYVRAMGGCLFGYDSDKGVYVNHMQDQGLVASWTKTLEAVDKKWLIQDHSVADFDRGRILFMWSGPYSARTRDDRQKALKEKKQLGVVALPTDSKNQTLYEYTAFGIPQGAKNAAAVPYYLRYVLDQQSYNMDEVYFSKEAQDVITSAIAGGNFFYGHAENYDLKVALYNGGPSQVKSTLNAYVGPIQEIIDYDNQRIPFLSN